MAVPRRAPRKRRRNVAAILLGARRGRGLPQRPTRFEAVPRGRARVRGEGAYHVDGQEHGPLVPGDEGLGRWRRGAVVGGDGSHCCFGRAASSLSQPFLLRRRGAAAPATKCSVAALVARRTFALCRRPPSTQHFPKVESLNGLKGNLKPVREIVPLSLASRRGVYLYERVTFHTARDR